MKPQLLETLYQNYARELLLYLYSLCRNQAMAEDLLQEVFLKALLSLQDTHPNFRAWLYLVAKNLYLNQVKHHPPAAIPDDASNPQDNPLELLLKQERLQLLFSALFSFSTGITGWNVSDIESLMTLWSTADIQVGGLLFSGLLISSLGAMMDVGISIASAIRSIGATLVHRSATVCRSHS